MDPPSSFLRAELCEWLAWRLQYPDEAVELIKRNDPVAFQILVDNLAAGACIGTDFSGTGGAHDAVTYLFQALCRYFQAQPRVHHYRACDLAKHVASMTVLCRRSGNFSIDHVFDDLNNRLPEAVRSHLDSLEPTAGSDGEERVRCYKSIIEVGASPTPYESL